jgi:hypothetical protein
MNTACARIPIDLCIKNYRIRIVNPLALRPTTGESGQIDSRRARPAARAVRGGAFRRASTARAGSPGDVPRLPGTARPSPVPPAPNIKGIAESPFWWSSGRSGGPDSRGRSSGSLHVISNSTVHRSQDSIIVVIYQHKSISPPHNLPQELHPVPASVQLVPRDIKSR